MPNNQAVTDVKPKNYSVNTSTQMYTDDRVVLKGQWIPLAGFTYPTQGTFTNAPRI